MELGEVVQLLSVACCTVLFVVSLWYRSITELDACVLDQSLYLNCRVDTVVFICFYIEIGVLQVIDPGLTTCRI